MVQVQNRLQDRRRARGEALEPVFDFEIYEVVGETIIEVEPEPVYYGHEGEVSF